MPRKVLLVNANRLQPPVAPLALDYLSDMLRAQDVSVELSDLCRERDPEQAIGTALSGFEPVLVAVTLRNTDDCYLASGENFVPGFQSIVRAIRRHTAAP